MSFAFQFQDEEMEEEYATGNQAYGVNNSAVASTSAVPEAEFKAYQLSELLDKLPARISYSSIDMTLQDRTGSQTQHRILRRDLFDARFQMLLADDEDSDGEQMAEEQDGQIDQNSDLIPGVYEGGLKTWECALDLVDVLNSILLQQEGTAFHNKQVLELGCGTALPTLFLLGKLLENKDTRNKVTFHLADYNAQVLNLVTLPNLILTWWNSTASLPFRTGSGAQISAQEKEELQRLGQNHFNTARDELDAQQSSPTGELSLSEELLNAFSISLEEHGVELRFYSGGWSHFPTSLTPTGQPIDILLTSETIYSLPTLPTLVDLLQKYASPSSGSIKSVCLVAAKVIYFGVGGGVEIFKQYATDKGAHILAIKTVSHGVGRTVLSVDFS